MLLFSYQTESIFIEISLIKTMSPYKINVFHLCVKNLNPHPFIHSFIFYVHCVHISIFQNERQIEEKPHSNSITIFCINKIRNLTDKISQFLKMKITKTAVHTQINRI